MLGIKEAIPLFVLTLILLTTTIVMVCSSAQRFHSRIRAKTISCCNFMMFKLICKHAHHSFYLQKNKMEIKNDSLGLYVVHSPVFPKILSIYYQGNCFRYIHVSD